MNRSVNFEKLDIGFKHSLEGDARDLNRSPSTDGGLSRAEAGSSNEKGAGSNSCSVHIDDFPGS